MKKEDKKALESVKDMFADVTIEDIDEQRITIYGAAMLDVIKVLTIVEKQQEQIKELKKIDESNSKIMLNMSERHFNDREKIRAYEKLVERIVTKIEELKKEKENYFEKQVIQHEIDMLQELLKRGE